MEHFCNPVWLMTVFLMICSGDSVGATEEPKGDVLEGVDPRSEVVQRLSPPASSKLPEQMLSGTEQSQPEVITTGVDLHASATSKQSEEFVVGTDKIASRTESLPEAIVPEELRTGVISTTSETDDQLEPIRKLAAQTMMLLSNSTPAEQMKPIMELMDDLKSLNFK